MSTPRHQHAPHHPKVHHLEVHHPEVHNMHTQVAKKRHVPLRRCVVCRQQHPQAALLRFFRDDAGQWQLDETAKAGGRGAWLCREADASVCKQANVKMLGRFFKNQAPRIYELLQVYRQQGDAKLAE